MIIIDYYQGITEKFSVLIILFFESFKFIPVLTRLICKKLVTLLENFSFLHTALIEFVILNWGCHILLTKQVWIIPRFEGGPCFSFFLGTLGHLSNIHNFFARAIFYVFFRTFGIQFKDLITGEIFITNLLELILLCLIEPWFQIFFEFLKLHDLGPIFKSIFIFSSFCVPNPN